MGDRNQHILAAIEVGHGQEGHGLGEDRKQVLVILGVALDDEVVEIWPRSLDPVLEGNPKLGLVIIVEDDLVIIELGHERGPFLPVQQLVAVS